MNLLPSLSPVKLTICEFSLSSFPVNYVSCLPVCAVCRVQPHSKLWLGMFKLQTFSGLKYVMVTVNFITFYKFKTN